jgi:hypothetical protein
MSVTTEIEVDAVCYPRLSCPFFREFDDQETRESGIGYCWLRGVTCLCPENTYDLKGRPINVAPKECHLREGPVVVNARKVNL